MVQFFETSVGSSELGQAGVRLTFLISRRAMEGKKQRKSDDRGQMADDSESRTTVNVVTIVQKE